SRHPLRHDRQPDLAVSRESSCRTRWKESGLSPVMREMNGFDEERIGRLLRLLPPAPVGWVRAAQELPAARAALDELVARAEEDAEAYRLALEARAAADERARPEQRDWALGQITDAAAEPPLALVRLAADLVELCAAAGARVEPRVHADVAAAAALAAAVARGARQLVAANLTALPGDARVEEADRLVADADAAARSL